MSLFSELKRRNVFRVGIAYALGAWVLLQGADFALDVAGAPDWIIRALVILAGIGLPAVLIFSWIFEMTPEGLKKESQLDRSQSIAPQTGHKLDRVIIAFLVVAVGVLLADRFTERSAPGNTEQVALPAPQASVEVTASNDSNSATVTGSEPAIDRQSVAVLPFAFRSTNPEDEFFAEGMHDDLLTQLAKIGSLKVISRTSVMEYKDTTKKIPEIAGELGVATIVEGGVQRSGSRVRINAQLIDASNDEHLWAETFNRELTAENLFEIQAEIAESIAQALQAELSPQERAQINRRLTNNLEAWTAYQRALASRRNQTVQEVQAGLSEINHAITLDPEFAAAYSLKAILLMMQYWFTEPNPKLHDLAWAAIERAREIDPDLPEKDIAEAYYHYWGFLDYEPALRSLDRALKAMPNHHDAHQARAYVLRRMGKFEEAIEELRIAVELNPRLSTHWADMGETYERMWQFDKAREVIARGEALEPDNALLLLAKGTMALMDSDTRLARYEVSRAPTSFQDTYVIWWMALLGDRDLDAALELANNWPESLLVSRLHYHSRDMLRGYAHHYMGDAELAQSLLLKAEEELLDRLSADPERFTALQSLCQVQGALGKSADAKESCIAARDRIFIDAFMRGEHLFNLAAGMAMAGHHDTAIEWLAESLATGAAFNMNIIRLHPAFESLFDKDAFKELESQYPAGKP